MPRFKLRFPGKDLGKWAARYEYPGDQPLMKEVGPSARTRGFLTAGEFQNICEWKTARTRSKCKSNPAGLVQEATAVAFRAKQEELKIGCLLVLNGVSWPTASVILHFCDRGMYPILDFRALWSLGLRQPPSYSFAFWMDYVQYMRRLHRETGMSMRNLDRALWQFSKENQ